MSAPDINPDSPLTRMGPDVVRCNATTKTNNPCPRPVQPGTTLCWTHGELAAGRTITPPSRRPKESPAPATEAEIASIVSELSSAEDAAGVRGVLSKVTGLVLAGKVPPRVGAAVSQLSTQVLRAIEQDHRAEMKRLHSILDKHPSTEVRGWSRRRKGARV